jgi:cytochrome c biogenesis protein ResB
MDDRNLPCALLELIGPSGSLGKWLVSSQTSARQEFSVGGKTYRIAMRFTRYYKDFSLKLLEFRHEKYRGTEIPRDFRSRVVIDNPKTGENREVEIYMNNPLRYGGLTFYQAGFDENNDNLVNKVTILQVVKNPGWLGPYLACAIMTLGLIVQFGIHLVGFVTKRRTL